MIFVNIPVRDLPAAGGFYEALGGKTNPQFSDARSTCVMFSDAIGVMLLTHERYGEFTKRPIGDARRESQALLALGMESRADVDAAVERGAKAGGRPDPNAVQDHGFMYNRTVEDPDGYVWELTWMDMKAFAETQQNS
jgi:hypothetical protein